MLSLYEILKASKTGIAPDMWTALARKNWGGKDSGTEVKELTGIPPLSFTADGTPLLDFLISGNMSQSGTPTPTTPIQPSECGEKTGNLFDKDNAPTIGWYCGSDDIIRSSTNIKATYIPCSANTTYTISKIQSAKFKVAWTANQPALGVTYYDLINSSGTSITITTGNAANYLYIEYYTSASDTHTEADIRNTIMLNTGSTALPYEPFGYKIPISSANTTTNIYLGEVQSTRKIAKYEFTGQEDDTILKMQSSGLFYLKIASELGYENGRAISSHYINQQVANVSMTDLRIKQDVSISAFGGRSGAIVIKHTDYTTLADFKTYLQQQYAAGTPVTVWYVLKTETTGVVNEPLRKIGNYADTLSMEQAGVQIPTNKGNTVFDVETTLKPSQMYIKYQE